MDSRIYTHDRYKKLLEETFNNIRELSNLKGGEYAGDGDRLANFRRNGADQSLPMETIWRVYAAKHWDAIGQYCKDRLSGAVRRRLESISGRADDLITYLILFKAMVDEDEVMGNMDSNTTLPSSESEARIGTAMGPNDNVSSLCTSECRIPVKYKAVMNQFNDPRGILCPT